MDRIRVRRIDAPVLPDYIPQAAIDEYFEFVSDRYDVTFLPWMHYDADQEKLTEDFWTRYLDSRSLTAIVYGFDDYRLPIYINRRATEICERCDLIFGPQLPADHEHPGMVPLCYPMLLHQEATPEEADMVGNVDITFWGDYIAGPKAVPPYPKEGENYRPNILATIEKLGRGRWRTDFRDSRFWYHEKTDRTSLTVPFRAAMMNSKLCLSLYGRGYNTIRTSDVFGLRRSLIGPDASQHVMMPEADLWLRQEICFTFKDDLSDLEEVIVYALSNPAERRRRVDNAWNYYRRHCTLTAPLRTIYKAIRREVDRRAYF